MYTPGVLENLDNSTVITEVWKAIYLITFSNQYSAEPRPYTDLCQELLNWGLLTSGLLFTDEDLHLKDLFQPEQLGLLFTNDNLYLNLLFEDEPLGLLFADKDLHLDLLFDEPEEPIMAAMAGAGGFNPNILVNTLNNLTNTLRAGGNNWTNVNNAMNALNAM
ncbi:hypothetical protein C1645_832074 [Glomus cerebriforme]|uniref:Uncharacterized protein n=1 Tax=Glomus cerebriforme TaxID=658196 RepID=A0A397SI69_9GLOM|nr:hypothetical protein C1645_832074 [Glomus cerebriforme]